MRIIFIPGLGEDPTIFMHLEGALPGEKIFINWEFIDEKPQPDINALEYAGRLINHFDLQPSDVIIGHSTGGWIGLHIKHLIGCKLVQLASWTAVSKVVVPFPNRQLIYWTIRNGLLFNKPFGFFLRIKDYLNKPSEELFVKLFHNMILTHTEFALNQARVIFNPIPERVTVEPDLRIHARNDQVVRYPDEMFFEVPGDHFSLFTHPKAVCEPLLAYLSGIRVEQEK